VVEQAERLREAVVETRKVNANVPARTLSLSKGRRPRAFA